MPRKRIQLTGLQPIDNMLTIVPLNDARNVTLDGSGNGQVSFGPILGQEWTVTNAGVQTSTRANPAASVPQCSIYIGGAPVAQFFIDGTNTGSLDSTDRTSSFPFTQGSKIWAVWTGGDPGSVATLSIVGTVKTGRR